MRPLQAMTVHEGMRRFANRVVKTWFSPAVPGIHERRRGLLAVRGEGAGCFRTGRAV